MASSPLYNDGGNRSCLWSKNADFSDLLGIHLPAYSVYFTASFLSFLQTWMFRQGAKVITQSEVITVSR